MVIRARERIVLFYSALRRPHLEYDVKLLEKVPRKAMRMIRLQDLSCEDRLRELDLFCLEKEKLQGGHTAALQYFKRA